MNTTNEEENENNNHDETPSLILKKFKIFIYGYVLEQGDNWEKRKNDYKIKVMDILKYEFYNLIVLDNKLVKVLLYSDLGRNCPNTSDEYVEEFCKENNIEIEHIGEKFINVGQKNKSVAKDVKKMDLTTIIQVCDEVFALWDSKSDYVAFVIAESVNRQKKVKVFEI